MNKPSAFVFNVRMVPCPSLAITTLAFGTVPLDGSRTTPEIPATPAAAWPNTGKDRIRENDRQARTRRISSLLDVRAKNSPGLDRNRIPDLLYGFVNICVGDGAGIAVLGIPEPGGERVRARLMADPPLGASRT